MPRITPGKTSNPIDRNANSLDRIRRNFQRMTQGAVTQTLSVDGTTIGINSDGQLSELHPIVINETPGGTIDGTNASFVLGNPPVDGTLIVMVDGVTMLEGQDYNLAASTITFVTAAIPTPGDWIRVTYRT